MAGAILGLSVPMAVKKGVLWAGNTVAVAISEGAFGAPRPPAGQPAIAALHRSRLGSPL